MKEGKEREKKKTWQMNNRTQEVLHLYLFIPKSKVTKEKKEQHNKRIKISWY